MFTITFIFINTNRFLLQIVKDTVKPRQQVTNWRYCFQMTWNIFNKLINETSQLPKFLHTALENNCSAVKTCRVSWKLHKDVLNQDGINFGGQRVMEQFWRTLRTALSILLQLLSQNSDRKLLKHFVMSACHGNPKPKRWWVKQPA